MDSTVLVPTSVQQPATGANTQAPCTQVSVVQASPLSQSAFDAQQPGAVSTTQTLPAPQLVVVQALVSAQSASVWQQPAMTVEAQAF